MNQNSIKRCAVTQLSAFWFLVQKHVGYILRFGRAFFMLSDRWKTFFFWHAGQKQKMQQTDRRGVKKRKHLQWVILATATASSSLFWWTWRRLIKLRVSQDGCWVEHLWQTNGHICETWKQLWSMTLSSERQRKGESGECTLHSSEHTVGSFAHRSKEVQQQQHSSKISFSTTSVSQSGN